MTRVSFIASVLAFGIFFTMGTFLAQCMLDTRPDVVVYHDAALPDSTQALNPCDADCCTADFDAGVATQFPEHCYGKVERDE